MSVGGSSEAGQGVGLPASGAAHVPSAAEMRASSSSPLFDMHCHLGFAANAGELAQGFLQIDGGALCATVTPVEYFRMQRILPQSDAVRLGVGLHPWWLSDGRCGESDVRAVVQIIPQETYIAEVGLDFGKRHVASREVQQDAFLRICEAAAASGGKVLSIHAANAAREVLDTLERTGCAGQGSTCACILHWYSGSSDQLQRAIALGCFFSVSEWMLRSRRGREYARVIPADRLLLETDLPETDAGTCDFARMEDSLQRALAQIEKLRGAPVREAAARNSKCLLSW